MEACLGFVVLDNRKVEHHAHMIEIEGRLHNQSINILIYSGASGNYIDLKLVAEFKLEERAP